MLANPSEAVWGVVNACYDPRWLEGVNNDLLMRFAVLVGERWRCER